eukprot:Blabericola_migrator_1__12882@NODE_840_length_6301_cov_128_082772_g593_i0_p2_GENE_NODE_840_length_6301_cov_128_082772_g593_i0NODE_840_length_6301_cov_128_082772_g593_i0_p2_ORF_typecomplete_len338_score59_30_NODE_840_length_6301_cov_128_082772_g593_i0891102
MLYDIASITQGGSTAVYHIAHSAAFVVKRHGEYRPYGPEDIRCDDWIIVEATVKLQRVVASIVADIAVTVPKVHFQTLCHIKDKAILCLHIDGNCGTDKPLWVGYAEDEMKIDCEFKPKSPLPLTSKHTDTRFNLQHSEINQFDFGGFFEAIMDENVPAVQQMLCLMRNRGRLDLRDPSVDLSSLAKTLIRCRKLFLWLYKHTVFSEGVVICANEIYHELASKWGADIDHRVIAELSRHLLPLEKKALDFYPEEKRVLEAVDTAEDLESLVTAMKLNEELAEMLVKADGLTDLKHRFLTRFVLGRVLGDVSVLYNREADGLSVIDFDTSKLTRKMYR